MSGYPRRSSKLPTAKELVQRRYKAACVESQADGTWKVYAHPPGQGGTFRHVLGTGLTAAAAWTAAASKEHK